jgi:hypothetical protein
VAHHPGNIRHLFCPIKLHQKKEPSSTINILP